MTDGSTGASAAFSTHPVNDGHKWWTLTAVSIATFMLLLDITIVNVALPDIQRSLHSSFTDLQWVVDAYALTLAAALLVSGSLADRIGRRGIFAAGLVIFSLSSLTCGLSGSSAMLNYARAVQGVGGAMMFATSLALIADAFRGKDRATAFGVIGGVTGAAVAVGPLIGGALTTWVGWEWIFFVNVPVGAITLVLTLSRVSESKSPSPGRIDWLGAAVFAGSLFTLVLALIKGNDDGWGSPMIISLLVASAVLMVGFVVVELRQRSPLLKLGLFRNPTFVGASTTAFTLSGGMFAMFLYLTLYLQDILGFTPLQAGLRLLPITVASFVVAPIAGRISAFAPAKGVLTFGLGMTGAGLLLMHGLTDASGWTALVAGFVVGGVGIGATNPTLASAAVGVVPPQQSGMASGINSTFRQVGIATGIATLGAIFQADVVRRVSEGLAGTPGAAHAAEIAHGISAGGAGQVLATAPPAARPLLLHTAKSAFVGALNEILIVGGVIVLVGAVLALVLVRQRDFVDQGAASIDVPQHEVEARAADHEVVGAARGGAGGHGIDPPPLEPEPAG